MVKDTSLNKIEKALFSTNKGSTIQQIMQKTKLARGTVKSHLDELVKFGRVHEEEYGQNTKVYFLNGEGKFQDKVQMLNDGILFVDVMTDPWKKPFIRVKYKNKEDKGAIFMTSEEAIDKLINILQNAKPQLKKYREIIQKIDA